MAVICCEFSQGLHQSTASTACLLGCNSFFLQRNLGVSISYWGYPQMVGLQWTISLKWMMTGGTPISRNLHWALLCLSSNMFQPFAFLPGGSFHWVTGWSPLFIPPRYKCSIHGYSTCKCFIIMCPKHLSIRGRIHGFAVAPGSTGLCWEGLFWEGGVTVRVTGDVAFKRFKPSERPGPKTYDDNADHRKEVNVNPRFSNHELSKQK